MIDFSFDTDLQFSNGDFSLVSKSEEQAQFIRLAFSMFRGEITRNLDFGLSYIDDILDNNNSLVQRETILREFLASLEGVVSISSLSLQIDSDRPRELVLNASYIDNYSNNNEASQTLPITMST